MIRVTLMALALSVTAAQAEPLLAVGTYLCTAEQRAGVGTTHLEGAPPPSAFSERVHYRFRIAVTHAGATYRIAEEPYDGPQRSVSQWEDDNSTLHEAYLGDGSHFATADRHGFLDFAPVRVGWTGDLQFYHAGYEYAGGEDETLSVRWGRCSRERS